MFFPEKDAKVSRRSFRFLGNVLLSPTRSGIPMRAELRNRIPQVKP
jgi:hypothetical protein